MREPSFFIIGAPKCGTTSLFQHLSGHPQVFAATNKEPFYFCTDMPGYRERTSRITNERDYLSLFAGATDAHLHLGEASVYYLFSRVAVTEILHKYPTAKFIVILRNPVDMVYSFHSELLLGGEENMPCFETAWSLQDARLSGKYIPAECRDSKVLQYRDVARFGMQVNRLLGTVPRSQVFITLLEDFRKQPRQTYLNLLSFLELDDDGRQDFPLVNACRVARSRFLLQLLGSPPYPLSILKRLTLGLLGRNNKFLRQVWELNFKPFARRPQTLNMRKILVDEFSKDVADLSEILSRDLSHWL